MKIAIWFFSSAFVAVSGQIVPLGWHVKCEYLRYTANIDPIVAPNAASSHLHDFVGSRVVTPNMSNLVLRNAPCTTCSVSGDKSAYWYPPVFQRLKSGQVVRLDPNVVQMYYLLNSPEPLKPFPDRLRMIAGLAKAVGPDPKIKLEIAIHKPNGTRLSTLASNYYTFPQSTKGESVTAVTFIIRFPNCILKSVYDSAKPLFDHTSYMKFAGSNEKCGADYYRIPLIHFHPRWSLREPVKWNNEQEIPLKLSSGEWGKGYSFHVDFMNGWDMGMFGKLMSGCANNALPPTQNFPCQNQFIAKEKEIDQCLDRLTDIASRRVDRWNSDQAYWDGIKAYHADNPSHQRKMLKDFKIV